MSNAESDRRDLGGANVNGVSFDKADLRGAIWQTCKIGGPASSWRVANIYGVKNPPDGLEKWAAEHGAVQIEKTEQWNAAIEASLPKEK